MERAARQLTDALLNYYPGEAFHIFCGMGNNGGDGLAVARLLHRENREVSVYIVKHSEEGSADFNTNYSRLAELAVPVHTISSSADFPHIKGGVAVDALLGSGLNRPLKGFLKEMVQWLNGQTMERVAIDIPTGLFTDDNEYNDLELVIDADRTLSLQLPKKSFFHRQTAPRVGRLNILDIGLHSDFLNDAQSTDYYFDQTEARRLYRPRKQYSYKGTYGHALLIAGSRGKSGAAILASRAAMRAGAGLVTLHTSASGVLPAQSTVPEVMVSVDTHESLVTTLPDISGIHAVGMGPGLGKGEETVKVLKNLIQTTQVPLVLDADALNILAENRTWMAFLPEGTVLTPHIGEFRRLLGVDKLGDDYLEQLRALAKKNRITIVLKDSNTAVASPSGDLHFINSGSPALATAGSGDVLTGIILGFLAQGYPSLQAALMGTWLHGRAGSLAGEYLSTESVMASDVTDYLSSGFKELARTKHVS
tara:strand:+ start:491 stop:1927 length:1437 start_codon:yes stop_codon:yes gene_type:complete